MSFEGDGEPWSDPSLFNMSKNIFPARSLVEDF